MGAPEQIFGVTGLTCLADGSITATMPTGPWLSSRPGDDRGTLGALGLLADTVFGHANHVVAPAGWNWSVTTELSLQLLSPLPVDGQQLVALARAVGVDQRSALTLGEIRTASGALVAVGSERGRFVPDGPEAAVREHGPDDDQPHQPAPPSAASLADLFGEVQVAEERTTMSVSPRVTNPRGNLHGGMSLGLADLAAATAVPELNTTSIHMTYARALAAGQDAIEVTATPTHLGRSLAVVAVRAHGRGTGKLIFAATVVRE